MLGGGKCSICGKSVYANDGGVLQDGHAFHKHCAKCFDCGVHLPKGAIRFASDYIDDDFILCKTHYDQRFSTTPFRLKQSKPTKATTNPMAPPTAVESGASEASYDPEAISKRESRSLFTPLELQMGAPLADEPDTSFLDEYSKPSEQESKQETARDMAHPGGSVLAVSKPVSSIFSDSHDVLFSAKVDGSHAFAVTLANEKGVPFPLDATHDDLDRSICVFSAQIFEKVHLTARLSTSNPTQYVFEIRNERPFAVGATLDFHACANLKNKVVGGPMFIILDVLGNGMTTVAATLVRADEFLEQEVALSVQIRSSGDMARKVDYFVPAYEDEETVSNNRKLLVSLADPIAPIGGSEPRAHDELLMPEYVDVSSKLTSISEEHDNVNSAVDELVQTTAVLLFTRQGDHSCIEVERLLQSMGVKFSLVDVDTLSVMKQVLDRLDVLGGFDSVPHLFVDGQSVGSCARIKRFERSMDLHVILAKHMNRDKALKYEESRLVALRLLFFPESVDHHATRVTAILVAVYSIVCAASFVDNRTRWAVLALAVDNLLRFVGGPAASVLGMIAQFLVSGWKADLVAGPPQQFTEFLSFVSSSIAAGCYLGRLFQLDIALAGVVVILLLAFFSLLDGVFRFSLGVYAYNFAYRLKLVRADAYRPHTHLLNDKKWEELFVRDAPKAVFTRSRHLKLPGQQFESPVDLIHKSRLELEFKLQDYSLVRHARVGYLACPMAVAALALVFRVLDNPLRDLGGFASVRWGTKLVSDSLSIIAVVLFGCLVVLYATKLIRFPKKCAKEWRDPLNGNLFQAFSICCLLFGLLLLDFYLDFGAALVWLGALLQMAMSVFRVSDLVYDYHSDDAISPALLIGPVGNFLSAYALASYGSKAQQDDDYASSDINGINYILVARFWFAVACLFGMTLFVITLGTLFGQSSADVRHRPFLWMWMAVSSAAGPAYLAVSNDSSGATQSDVLYHSTWLISVFFFAMNVTGFLKGFYSFVEDPSIWVVAFSSCLLSIHTVQYYSSVVDPFSLVLVVFSVSFSCYAVAMCALHSWSAYSNKNLFHGRPKFGPATFIALTHESFRYSIMRIIKLLDDLKPDSLSVANVLIDELKNFFTAYREHTRQEEKVYFPLVRGIFPGLNAKASEEHKNSDKLMDFLLSKLVQVKGAVSNRNSVKKSSNVIESVAILKTQLPVWCYEALDHMRHEEDTMSVVIRKYMPIEQQRDAARNAFDSTSVEDWHRVLPFLLKNLPSPSFKIRLIRSLVWAVPERSQEIGLIVYRGVDSVMWAYIIEAVPEIIPRGVPGFARIY